MRKYYTFTSEVVLFDGITEYAIYIPLEMCQKMDGQKDSVYIKKKNWIYMGVQNSEHYYYKDEGCLHNMNSYLKVRGGGRIMHIIVTRESISCPIVYPVQSNYKHLPFIMKAIKDIK